MQARYVHTNLIARDWRSLSRFYVLVFGCTAVLPERDLWGPLVEAGTGLAGAHIRGIHLRLPGHGENGPTLEVFQYGPEAERVEPVINRPGFGHIAFQVDDVHDARRAVLEAGGRAVGEVVTLEIANGARVTWCYVTDPEGNMLELQSWA